MQKSYADCAIHIVCIFGLTGEVISQTLVVGNFLAPHESSTFNYMQHYLRFDSSRLLYLLGDKFHKTYNL